ncbi:PPC domain-containing DNA-binding protein [Piscinibacter sakaiensis]|uniref:hypothetical protein n=1 Tax=Piscinibacter sakaiensis TaxID=1547922 RepID=UPI00372D0232
MDTVALRLHPGDDLRLALEARDATGAVRGGHVCAGCRVRTTLELLVALLPAQRFSRRHDPVTGYPELVVEPLVPGPFTGV